MMHLMHKSELRKQVGENIAYERQYRGMSQAALAAALSQRLGRTFDQATVARLEKGRRPLDVFELTELATLLGVHRDELLEPPSEYRWRQSIDRRRAEAHFALQKIGDAAADYYEAAVDEVNIVEGLANHVQVDIRAEADRPDPSLPLRVCIEALMQASGADGGDLDERARKAIEQLVRPDDWAPTRLEPFNPPRVYGLPPLRVRSVEVMSYDEQG
jgi:transcriptional regulator with XRE-family HTH domain